MGNKVTVVFLASTLDVKSTKWLLWSGDTNTSAVLPKHDLQEWGRDLYFSSFLSAFFFFFAAQPAISFALGLWCWYICKLTNLTVTASCCFLHSLHPGVWLCTLILQGHKSVRIALNYCSHFLLVTSASKFHLFFEAAWIASFLDLTNHTYLSMWSHHCSDNRRYILWTRIKHISGASDEL